MHPTIPRIGSVDHRPLPSLCQSAVFLPTSAMVQSACSVDTSLHPAFHSQGVQSRPVRTFLYGGRSPLSSTIFLMAMSDRDRHVKRTANDGLDLISNRFLVLTRGATVSTYPHLRL